MNQAQVKTTIPEHIDPREIVKKVPTADIINMSNMMKASGTTPWRYVRAAFKKLTEGDYDQAAKWMDYARDFAGVFYKEGSEENDNFIFQISMLSITLLSLTEKFRNLKPEE
jgi:hypothetical protein